MIFGELAILNLIIATGSVSFLSNAFVISEIFCNINGQQFSHQYNYQRTFVEHPVPANAKHCLIRLRDILGNIYIKYIVL